jgi:hypothetical protein
MYEILFGWQVQGARAKSACCWIVARAQKRLLNGESFDKWRDVLRQSSGYEQFVAWGKIGSGERIKMYNLEHSAWADSLCSIWGTTATADQHTHQHIHQYTTNTRTNTRTNIPINTRTNTPIKTPTTNL